jgi:hypothetical protein
MAASILAVVLVTPPLASAAGKGPRVEVPHFVEEAIAAGVEHTYDGSWEFFVGGGVAPFDCDDDGRPDLYFAGGSGAAGKIEEHSASSGSRVKPRT